MSLLMKMMGVVAKLKPDRPPDPLIAEHRYIGQPIDRLDGAAKVTGAATFTAEVKLDGMLYAELVYSTIAKGTITHLETARAAAAPGVVRVITHETAPKMAPPPVINPAGQSADTAASSVNVLNTDQVSWNGQPIAIVVADTQDRAEQAARMVRVTYAQDRAATSFAAAKRDTPKDILGEDTELRRGDAETALRAAEFSVDHHYETPFLNHNAIEPHAVVATWTGDFLTVHSSSQYVQGEAHTLGKIFGLPKGSVRVLAPFVGGGFGGKGFMFSHVQLTALAAKVVGKPVRLALSREGVFRAVGGRTRSEQRVALGARGDGTLTALVHTGVAANSPDNEWPEQFTFPSRHLYATETFWVTQAVARLNMMANCAMRAPGESIGTFALDSAMDELAHALHMDPIALRVHNEPKVDPTTGAEFSSRHLALAYRTGAEKFGWRDRNPAPRSTRDGEWLVGQGVGTAYYPVYRLPSGAAIRILADGSAVVRTSAHEMGMGTSTAQTQHAAERMALPMERIRFEYGDSELPVSNQAGGSSQTVSLALAVQEAFAQLTKQLLELAQGAGRPLAGARPDQIHARDAGLYRIDRPEVGETYAAILAAANLPFVEAEAHTGQPLESLKYSMGSYGAHFCEVRVHEQTGEVRVSRWLAMLDTGRTLNPKLARSQLRGGIIMGIGMALSEETLFDERSGRIANPSLAEYHVPVHADIPALEIELLDIPDPHTPLGAHGIGEIGITGTAAAIANAIFHATGKRIRSLPITLDKLM